MVAWKSLVLELRPILLRLAEEVACEPLWWSPFLPLIGPWFFRIRASQLHRAGLRCVQDARSGENFMNHNDAMVRYGIKLEERGA